MNLSPTIYGDLITLRRPIDQDILDYYHCPPNKELTRMYGGDSRNLKPRTMSDAKAFIERIRKNKLEWCIEFKSRCIGQARLTVNPEDNRARYAIGIFDPGCWGQGIGTEVTNLVLSYAFEELKLHRVDLKVLEYNRRAIRCYEKCGFIIEGIEREGALIEGKYETDVIMSILEHEYKKGAAR